ncbi:hypothetical protein QCA50_004378 [Cerrena zonata]|uniref:UDP-N-acetylglucosamine transferase subunit ALG14 n=1 Tax=Cerrena zonata TaxID=2478898 RepID=A0AAW0GHI7_9APHY
MVYTIFLILSLALLCVLLRFVYIMPRARKPISAERRSTPKTFSLAVFLGSGGHTSEALTLLSALDFTRYSPRSYVYSQGDILSAKKAVGLELLKTAESSTHPVHGADSNPPYSLVCIPRARRVHQPLITTPVTAAHSLAFSLYYFALAPAFTGKPFADVLILNGPGTCCMLCLAVYFNKFFGLPAPRMIYVESFARVKRLSLSGKLLRPFVDRFIVQWPDLLNDGGRGECRGWLV